MVAVTLSHIKPLDRYNTERPYWLNIPGDERSQHIVRTNLEYCTHDGIKIEDLRNHGSDTFSLESDGFEILNYETQASVQPDGVGVGAYCEEIAGLVSKKCDAAHAICYDYRVRPLESPSLELVQC